MIQSRKNDDPLSKKKWLYWSEFKSWEFDKEAAQIFCSGTSSFVHEQSASEDKKCAAKPTPEKTNFWVHFSYRNLLRNDQLTNLIYKYCRFSMHFKPKNRPISVLHTNQNQSIFEAKTKKNIPTKIFLAQIQLKSLLSCKTSISR